MATLRDRYLIREFGTSFASLLFLLLLLFSMESFLRIALLLVDKAFSPAFVAAFFGLSVCATIPYAVPVAFLCGMTSVFTRLTIDREILVLATSGINPFVLARPLIWIAACAALVLTYCNFSLLPAAKLMRKRLVREARVDNPVGLLRPKTVVHDIPGMAIYTGGIGRGGSLRELRISWTDAEGRQMQIAARSGRARYLSRANALAFSLADGTVTVSGGKDPRTLSVMRFSSYEFRVALPDAYRRTAIQPKLPEMTFGQLRRCLPQMDAVVELHRRLVYASAPLFLVLFGTGAGLRLRSPSKSVHLGLGILASLAFFELLTVGEVLAFRSGAPAFLWLPSAVFTLAGFRLWMSILG